MPVLLTVLFFIIKLFFSLIFFILWLRVALKYFRVSTLHPVSQLIHECTKPLLSPFDQMLQSQKKVQSRYDLVGFIGIGLVELVKFVVLGLIVYRVFLPPPYLLVLIIGDFIVQPCNLLFYATIIRVIMSWVSPQNPHPFVDALRLITDPILSYIGRYLPPVAGFDLSPLAFIMILLVISMLVSAIMPLPLL